MLSTSLVEKYLLKDDLSTYDPYDIWKTNIGMRVKQLYYKNKYLGLIPAGILTIYDMYINNSLRIGYKKQEYPIVRAHAALALLNLYKKEPKDIYLEYAKKHIDWLIKNSSKGYSGYCWGLNFDWVYSKNKIYNKNTPFSTHTPYPLEALVKYYKITKDKSLIKPIKSVFLFLENDIKIMKETTDMLIVSYGVEKDRIVTNANSYVMYMYSLLIEFFPEQKEYIVNKVNRLYNFIVSVQNKDGSWFYQPYDDSFIDCFHSVFIIKNIYKTNQIVKLEKSEEIIYKAYKYLEENFFDVEYNLFRHFSISDKPNLIKFDLYDNAEMLYILKILKQNVLLEKLKKSIEEKFIDTNGSIFSKITKFGKKIDRDTLRWAVMPYIYNLSEVE